MVSSRSITSPPMTALHVSSESSWPRPSASSADTGARSSSRSARVGGTGLACRFVGIGVYEPLWFTYRPCELCAQGPVEDELRKRGPRVFATSHRPDRPPRRRRGGAGRSLTHDPGRSTNVSRRFPSSAGCTRSGARLARHAAWASALVAGCVRNARAFRTKARRGEGAFPHHRLAYAKAEAELMGCRGGPRRELPAPAVRLHLAAHCRGFLGTHIARRGRRPTHAHFSLRQTDLARALARARGRVDIWADRVRTDLTREEGKGKEGQDPQARVLSLPSFSLVVVGVGRKGGRPPLAISACRGPALTPHAWNATPNHDGRSTFPLHARSRSSR